MIFKRLGKDREQREEEKAKRKHRSELEIKIGDKKVEQVTNDACILDTFWYIFLVFIFSTFMTKLIWFHGFALFIPQ